VTDRRWTAMGGSRGRFVVIHGVAAGMRRESQRRLWYVRYTDGGRLERRVERWAAQWRNVSPDWLITYPVQAVHHVYRLPVLQWNILLKTQNVHIDKDTFYFDF